MTIETRLEVLDQRHKDIELALTQELRYPAMDDLRINDLKKQKLRIKDEMTRLSEQSIQHA